MTVIHRNLVQPARRFESQRQDAVDDLLIKRPDTRRPRLVPQQAVDALLTKSFLPTPDVFLRGVAIPDDGLKTMAVIRGNLETDTGAHATDSHAVAASPP